MANNNGYGNFSRIMQGVITALAITALVGLIALRDTARANTIRLDRIEPAAIQTAKDISAMRTDIAVIKKVLEIKDAKEQEK